MRMPDIVWESVSPSTPCSSVYQYAHGSDHQYHSDGRPRNTPLPSTVHGWLTKMRGTLFDNEAMRYRGIKEMQQAAVVRVHRQKAEADLKARNLARAQAGKAPLKPSAKPPLLRLSFMPNRPKPVAGASGRPAARARKASSSHTQKRKPISSSSRARHSSSSGKRSSRRPPSSRKSSHASHTSKRSPRK